MKFQVNYQKVIGINKEETIIKVFSSYKDALKYFKSLNATYKYISLYFPNYIHVGNCEYKTIPSDFRHIFGDIAFGGGVRLNKEPAYKNFKSLFIHKDDIKRYHSHIGLEWFSKG